MTEKFKGMERLKSEDIAESILYAVSQPGRVNVGEVLVVEDGDLMDQKIIINFPTKSHWKCGEKRPPLVARARPCEESYRTMLQQKCCSLEIGVGSSRINTKVKGEKVRPEGAW